MVKNGDYTSSTYEIKGGIPQGTKLGPLIYVIYCLDLIQSFNNKFQYMDDTTIFEVLKNDEVSTLQSVLDQIIGWCSENYMQINPTKSAEILFHFSRSKKIPDPFVIDNTPIMTFKQQKLLGVIISEDLSWSENTKYILKKANTALYALRFLKSCKVPKSFLFSYYKSSIRSLLEYCSPLWHFALSKKDCEELERIQRRAMRIINGYFELETLESRRTKCCSNTFTKVQSQYPELLQDFRSNCETRSQFILPKFHTNRTKNSFISGCVRHLLAMI